MSGMSSAVHTEPVRRISVMVPMRNEADHVERLVEDLAAQDFEGELEVLVADGRSTDDSVARLVAAARRAGLELTLIENQGGWVSQGLNACIRRAGGDLIVRLDCHSRYPPDYLRRCALAAEETGAVAVGGIVVPHGRTAMERAVAAAMDGPFGGIGWMRDTGEATRRETDIFTYGAFRPAAFERAGFFDESLIRNQDDEFTLRLRLAGEVVLLDSAIQVHYTPRGSLAGVFRQYYEYGLWKVPVIRKHRKLPSPRSLAPLALVVSLAVLGPSAVRFAPARRLLGLELAAYTGLALTLGASGVRRRGEPWGLVARTLAVFPAFHLGYGAGMLHGWLRAALGR